jgi:tetratricopeptide (TPR) repeat protein
MPPGYHKFQLLKTTLMKKQFLLILSVIMISLGELSGQGLRLPNSTVNYPSIAGRTLGVTEIEIRWNAPGVKGREGKIWGTETAPFGFEVLGFGSSKPSPWRAGADENTTISFSTDVKINGQTLPAGKYGFLIALYQDSCTLIFNKNTEAWGGYFYRPDLDVLRVKTIQQKDQKQSVERLAYIFSDQTSNSIEIALEWERWKIPFKVEVDLAGTTLASIRKQLSGALGFDPPSLQAAANWCLVNNTNYEEGLEWINRATEPNLGGTQSFGALSIKSGLLEKMNRKDEADKMMTAAIENGSAIELHQYGRRLLMEKKNSEAMKVFEKNYIKHKGAWPTNAGMMRGYSAMGNYKKALEHAKLALPQATDEVNKKSLEAAIKTLSEGKPL